MKDIRDWAKKKDDDKSDKDEKPVDLGAKKLSFLAERAMDSPEALLKLVKAVVASCMGDKPEEEAE